MLTWGTRQSGKLRAVNESHELIPGQVAELSYIIKYIQWLPAFIENKLVGAMVNFKKRVQGVAVLWWSYDGRILTIQVKRLESNVVEPTGAVLIITIAVIAAGITAVLVGVSMVVRSFSIVEPEQLQPVASIAREVKQVAALLVIGYLVYIMKGRLASV